MTQRPLDRKNLEQLRNPYSAVAAAALFLSCIIGSWVWFNVGAPDPRASYSGSQPRWLFSIRTNIPAYTYIPETVRDEVKKMLGTTDILNGTFVRKPLDTRRPTFEDRITIFLASWPAKSKQPMLILGHTPDICWTSSGWKPVDLGQPKQITLNLPRPGANVPEVEGSALDIRNAVPNTTSHGAVTPEAGFDIRLAPSDPSASLPFECRVFESFGGTSRELAVWCTLIDGQALAATADRGESPASRLPPSVQARLTSLDQLWRATRHRLPVRGAKQFVRFSMPVTDNWEMTLDKMKTAISRLSGGKES
jgi:hypothetical protein